MSKDVDIRLTRTQYEKLVLYAFIGNYIESFDDHVKQRDADLLNFMLLISMRDGLGLEVKEEGDLILNEKMYGKMIKLLARYNELLLKESIIDILEQQEEQQKKPTKKKS